MNEQAYFQLLTEQGEFNKEEAPELRVILTNKVFLSAIATAIRPAADRGQGLVNIPLGTPEQVYHAAVAQGYVHGAWDVIRQLLTLTEVAEDDSEEGDS